MARKLSSYKEQQNKKWMKELTYRYENAKKKRVKIDESRQDKRVF